MSAALRTRLEMDRSQFSGSATAARKEVADLTTAMQNTSAAVIQLQRDMRTASGGTDAQKAALKGLREEYQGYAKDLRTAKAELKGLGEVGPSDPHHGGGNKAGLAHSARATLEMMMAGQSPLQALQVETPKIIQSFGGGLGTMIGVGAALAGVNKIAESIGEGIAKAKELGNNLRDALRPGPSQGEESIERTQRRIEGLSETIDAAKPKLGFFEHWGQRISSNVARNMAATGRAFRGDKSDLAGQRELMSDPKNDLQTQNEALRNEAIKERNHLFEQVNDKLSEENDLREEGFRASAASVKQAELELQKRRELAAVEEELGIARAKTEIRKINDNPAYTDKQKADRVAQIQKDDIDPQMDALKGRNEQIERKYNLQQRAAKVGLERQHDERNTRQQVVDSDHPGIMDYGKEDPNLLNLPGAMTKNNRGLRHASQERDKARANFETVKEQGGDTVAARLALEEAESQMRDQAIDEALKTPQQRAADRAQLMRRQQAERRLEHRGTRDADEEGSAINDVDRDGSVIPEAGTGFGAAESTRSKSMDSIGNHKQLPAHLQHEPQHMDGPKHMPGPTHMPDRGFLQDNRPDPAAFKPNTAQANDIKALIPMVGLLGQIRDKLDFKEH